jgi:hypothetical protein
VRRHDEGGGEPFPLPQAPPRCGELGGLSTVGGVLTDSGGGSVAGVIGSRLSKGGSGRAPNGGMAAARRDDFVRHVAV